MCLKTLRTALVSVLAHLSLGSQGELIRWDSSRRLSVCLPVSLSKLSNMNVSETSGTIEINFHLKHYMSRGKASSGFHYYLLSLQLDVVPCGGRKRSPRTHL